MGDVAYIFYGRGSSLGRFTVFARSLARELSAKFDAANIITVNVETRADFFGTLESPRIQSGQKIAELHVFSHSIGGGLFLSYGDHQREEARRLVLQRAQARGRKLSYDEVILNEPGVLFTDNLIRRPWGPKRVAIRPNFKDDATIKLWGCNARVSGWTYSDWVGGDWVTASNVGRIDEYYWRALNEQNMPKPSIVQAFADYFQRDVIGANSGSHIEVRSGGSWMRSNEYRARYGHFPSGNLPHKLVPDQGTYQSCQPSPTP